MENYSVYEDVASRTNGAFYIGVVGPVRTGKSTFIKRFMEKLVLPFIEERKKDRMRDELPQSASGKTVMTTEPKFVPNEEAQIRIANGCDVAVRLVFDEGGRSFQQCMEELVQANIGKENL